MTAILQRMSLSCTQGEDLVCLTVNHYEFRLPYQTALELSQHIRVAGKQAAEFDNAPASFWRDVEAPDIDDVPRANPYFRRGNGSVNVQRWQVRCAPPMVQVQFDQTRVSFPYEKAIAISNLLRKHGRIAKAWAGDTDRRSRMIGVLSNGAA